jgi:iron complex transport system permease protein
MPRTFLVLAVLVVVLVASGVVGTLLGAVPIAPGDILAAIFGSGEASTVVIVRDLRMPRVLGAGLVGGALAVAGALLQGILRNPLADPYVTGTSAGASLGAVVAIAFGGLTFPALLPLAAFAGALLAVAATWRLAALGGRTTVLTVLLGGIVLSSFAGAVLTFLLVASDRVVPQLRAVLGWLLGGVAILDRIELFVASIIVVAGLVASIAIAPRIDAFAFGEEAAASLGIDVDRTVAGVLSVAALLTGAAVALAGIVGFVGLVVPHALRPIVGAAHRRLIPASFLTGAATLVLADAGARTFFAPTELPVGVITGLIGGPFFLALLVRERRRLLL